MVILFKLRVGILENFSAKYLAMIFNKFPFKGKNYYKNKLKSYMKQGNHHDKQSYSLPKRYNPSHLKRRQHNAILA